MGYEYKCVGAPERPKRQRGVRGRSDRVALAMQELIAGEAIDGWEYQRTDLVPVEEKSGWFGRAQEVHRAVLVFRRELEPEPRVVAPGRLRTAAAQGQGQAQDAGFGAAAGPHSRPAEEETARRIPLAADRDGPPARTVRDEPAPPVRANRPPPLGLG